MEINFSVTNGDMQIGGNEEVGEAFGLVVES